MASALAKLSGSALASSSLPGGLGTRAAALLARQALEAAVEAELHADLGADPGGSMRARLLTLVHLDPTRGGEASHLWWSLTRACHQHQYELSPTAREVRGLVDRVVAWVAGPPISAR